MDDALGWISGASQQAEWLGPRPGRDVSARSETGRNPQVIKLLRRCSGRRRSRFSASRA